MNVKISVKKLFNMEQLIADLKDGQKRYRDQVANMFNEHEDLKNLYEDKVHLHLQQLTEINELKKDVEILSHQLKHSRKLANSWSKDFVESNDKCKELKVLHEKEIKLLEQRNDALDKQWRQQEMQINGLVDENDTLKVKIKDLNVLHEKEMIKLIDQRNDALDKYYEALKLPSTQQKALKRIQTSPYPVFERGEEDES